MGKYNIGLDIGTTSVGWAVVNSENYKVIRKGNKKLWGVRLFDEANTAVNRRMARGTRRRYDRRRKRIKLLQQEFKESINAIDPLFFEKMKQSFYQKDDTLNRTINISEEESAQIRKFYQKYPTIYHLRDKLIKSKDKEDIRLVYLAIHHIIKYRGNFLYDNAGFNVKNIDIKSKFESVFSNLHNMCNDILIDENINYEKLETILLCDNMNDRKKLLTDEFKSFINSKCVSEYVKLLLGYQVSVSKLFNEELDEEIKINFKGTNYEDNYALLEKMLGEKIELLQEFKELYDMIFLKNLFKGQNFSYLSELMVYKYDRHKADLKILKKIFKNNAKLYKQLFKDKACKEEESIYSQYIKNAILYEDFSKIIVKLLDDASIDDNANSTYIKDQINKGEFLPRITDIDNGKYPYQLNLEELKSIIENQGVYYPFLLDTCGSDNKYKLVKILSFRIPYYVGPLGTTTNDKNIKNQNSWLIRKDNNVLVTPYNFDEVIDKEATAELFISRMLSNCTYLLKEKAMANNSILYCRFKVLNELKQIKINGKSLDLETQKEIYKNLFLKTNKSITETMLINYLKSHNVFPMYDNFDISGYSDYKKFANNMSSYVDFFGQNGFFANTSYTINDAEQIIKWITIFEDKSILETKIRRSYGELTENTIKLLVSKRYKGWGRLSEKLLVNKYYVDSQTKERKSIIDIMEETSFNFMQIINKKEYGFQKMIDELNNNVKPEKISYDIVKDLVTSPSTKRAIYQSLKVIEEIVNYMGSEPESINIEMARGEDTKRRTENRKNMLLKTYETCKNDISNYNQLCKELKSFDKIDSQKMFLYFIQEGKSLYSGKSLDINQLEDYEIDHIIPQSLIKDDSIDNKALVLRIENQEKRANFVLPSNFRTFERKEWWRKLRKNGLISVKKLNNLLRDNYSSDDIEGFINRQLVETRQITKHVANIINSFYENTKVVYLHANLSHNYREKFELFKYRDLNDIHHAHDAYLAAVIGDYQRKYLKKVDFTILKELNKLTIENGDYSKLKYGYVINSMDSRCFKLFDEKTGEINEFDVDKFNGIIKDTLYQNNVIVSKKTEIKNGEFYNQTKSKKGKKGIELKNHLPIERYGSYTSLNPSYAVVVRYDCKGKDCQRLVGIPIYIVEKSRSNSNYLNDYLKDLLKLNDSTEIIIIKDKIPFYTVLDWNGQLCCLVGATDKVEVCNAKQFTINRGNVEKWKYSLNRLFNGFKCVDDIVYQQNLVEIGKYILNKIETEYVLYKNLLDELREYFINFEILDLSIKEKIIKELFNLFKFNSKCANLKDLNSNASSYFGKKNSRLIEHATIINKSVTGIWEKKSVF